MPAGEKLDALLLMNDIATKLQRGFFLPKGAPDDAVADLRRGYQALANDPDFVADYERVTKEKPDFVSADEVQLVFDKMRAVRPEIRQVLKVSIGG
jgi:tripartite-type tricarboxylate transporter receptor subunit TctC